VTLLAGLAAQVLHIVLMAAAAPTLTGICRWMQARLAGRAGPSLLQPWRDLTRLLRKQVVLAESASAVTEIAPVVCGAAVAVCACLVPAFTVGMALAPFADLLAIAGLLVVARCSMALSAMDAGTAPGGMAAGRTMLLGCLAEPALLLVMLVLALTAGSLNLDVIVAAQMENGADWRIGVAVAFAAMLLVAPADSLHHEALTQDASGPNLALVEAAASLRLLVWCNLIGAIFLPFGMALADAGLLAWAVGIVCWAVRTLLMTGAWTLLHAVLGRIGLVVAARALGVATLLGLLAAVLLFAEMGTA
jgi:formate hydrogenlyase subunit 4